MSSFYEALAIKAIEGAKDAENAKRALEAVKLRAVEGSIDREVFSRCRNCYAKTWEVNE